MKKTITLFLILLLSSSCSIAKYDTIHIASSAIQLNDRDAADAYEFLQETIKKGTSQLNPEDKYIGGQTISIFVKTNGITTQYAFLLDTLYVYEENTETKEYKINSDYYENEFYPFISKICDQYFPAYYQVTNNTKNLSIKVQKDGKEEAVNREDILDLAQIIAYNYFSSEMTVETYENELCHLIIEDGYVNEVIHCFEDYIVINMHKIIIPNEFYQEYLQKVL